MFNTYRLLIRYRQHPNTNSGLWLTFADYYSGYSLDEAIEACKRNNAEEFEHHSAYIDSIWRETDTDWTKVDWD